MPHHVVTPGNTLRERAAHAVHDDELQHALRNLDVRLHTARHVAEVHTDLKDRAAAIRRETLADLDGWVARAADALTARGVTVHHAATPSDARRIVLAIARAEGARTVVKSKSMATEEVDLVDALAAADVDAVETDLGEYIVQVAGERPSHMITPAIHKTLGQIADVLATRADEPIPVDREAITAWARDHLRRRFLAADLGITGANFVTADTGTLVLVTNEGNGDLCTIVPRVQVSVVPVEKVVPRFADLGTLLPVLTMSATGQRLSNYVTMMTGPRGPDEIDGPERLHVVFLDHGRRHLVGTAYEEMLACIRCGACLNVCPVFRAISGHAYDAVYSGPMGAVLTPLLSDGASGRDLPAASTLCGACTEACPVEIPLADFLVRLRADLRAPGSLRLHPAARSTHPPEARPRRPADGYPWWTRHDGLGDGDLPRARRRALADLWARVWASPTGYRVSTGVVRRLAPVLGRRGWTRRRAPGIEGWTRTRDAPLPARRSFQNRWRARGADGERSW